MTGGTSARVLLHPQDMSPPEQLSPEDLEVEIEFVEELHDLDDPQIAESIALSEAAVPSLPRRGVRWVRAHWAPVGLIALGLLMTPLARLVLMRARPA